MQPGNTSSCARSLWKITVIVWLTLGSPASANLLIAMNDISGQPPAVRRFDEITGSHLGIVATSPELVEGMTVGTDGKLYVCFNNVGLGFIKKYDLTTGAFIGDFASNVNPAPHRLRFGADGNLYTAEGNGIRRFNGNTGQDLGYFVPSSTNGLNSIVGLVFQPITNDLLVTDGKRINRYDETTGVFLGAFNAAAASAYALRDPLFGPDGNLYIDNAVGGGAWTIERFDGVTGASLGTFVSQPDGSKQARFTFGPGGNIYSGVFTSSSQVEVRRYNGTSGAYIDTFIAPNPQLYSPFEMMFAIPEPGTSLALVLGVRVLESLGLLHDSA